MWRRASTCGCLLTVGWRTRDTFRCGRALLFCALAYTWLRWCCWMGVLSGALYRGRSGCTRRVIVTTSCRFPAVAARDGPSPLRLNASLSTLPEVLFEKIARAGPMYSQGNVVGVVLSALLVATSLGRDGSRRQQNTPPHPGSSLVHQPPSHDTVPRSLLFVGKYFQRWE